jgi:hypothetical protein
LIDTSNESRGCKSSAGTPSELQIGANDNVPATAQRLSHSPEEADPSLIPITFLDGLNHSMEM